jgi:Flp pilus assembly protein TadG
MRFRVLRPFAVSAPLLRFWRCDSGVNAIEFAFVVPFIVTLLLATTQIAVVFIAQAYLGYVSEAAMRIVLTNQAGSMKQSDFKTAVCNKIVTLFNCGNLVVDLEPAPTSVSNMSSALPKFDSAGNLIKTTNYSVAPAPAKMMLVVMYQWPIVGGPLGFSLGNMGNGTLLMSSTQVFQIEPSS